MDVPHSLRPLAFVLALTACQLPSTGPGAQPVPLVVAAAQTKPVSRVGDAADDPAIWLHPQDPARSLVLGTNKKEGLLVYDLAGELVQSLPVGPVNNVDVRYGLSLDGRVVDVAAASNRGDNTITVFAIARDSGRLSEVGRIPAGTRGIYGLCMYQPAAGELYVVVSGTDGEFEQYRLRVEAGRVTGDLVRRFRVGSKAEGCVADDRRRRLFVSEEDVAVWALAADPETPAEKTEVVGVGGPVEDDIEGLAIYRGNAKDYLVISSQGNDSYVVLEAEPPYRLRGVFRIGRNAAAGIDGASETDGLEVTSVDLGGFFGEGMLVVQDGRRFSPETPQNFKYVPWIRVREALGLE